MSKITDLQRSETSDRTKLEVSATVADLQTLSQMIICAHALSGELRGNLTAKTKALHVVFTFKDWKAHYDFHSICLSLR